MKEFILKGVPGAGGRIEFQNELNEEQFAVVEQGSGAALVLAGAGSGKTRTITYRVAWLLEQGVEPDAILLLTFTNKAAKEMTHRIEQLLGRYPAGLWSGTFHSVANRLLRRYADAIGFTSHFSILDQEDSRELVSLIMKEMSIKATAGRFPKASVLHSIISYQRNKSCTMEKAVEEKHPRFLPFLDSITKIAARYREQKKAQNSMDFDDLLVYFLQLLREHERVRDTLARQFQFILVDEFQDTNSIQSEIVYLLASVHGNVLVVGDDAQSIYSFRAAEIQNILQFPKKYPDSKTFRLTKNYRSTPQILTLANESILHNEEQFEKQLQPVVGNGELPLVVPAQNSRQEAQYIAEQILEIAEKDVPLKEIAVLFRAAFHSQQLEFELMRLDIPYEYRGGLKFFERAHVKDVVAHLRIMYNVKDAMAWIRALKLHAGVGLVTANKIATAAQVLDSFVQAGSLQVKGKKASEGWARFLGIHKVLIESNGTVSAAIRAFAGSDEYLWYLENEYPNFEERLEDLEQFAVFSEQFDDMGAFLEAVTLTDEFGAVREGDAVQDSDRIVLSTIHQAKGLEWDNVFVMHLAEGLFPGERAKDEKEMEEERRLFYVAVTRARKQLFLTYPVTAGFDRVELKQPSLFLEELPKKLTEEVRLKSPSFWGAASRDSFESAKAMSYADDDGPVIVFDDMGEQKMVKKPKPTGSFLIDLDDL